VGLGFARLGSLQRNFLSWQTLALVGAIGSGCRNSGRGGVVGLPWRGAATIDSSSDGRTVRCASAAAALGRTCACAARQRQP